MYCMCQSFGSDIVDVTVKKNICNCNEGIENKKEHICNNEKKKDILHLSNIKITYSKKGQTIR